MRLRDPEVTTAVSSNIHVHVAGFVILHACARGKAISCIVVVIVVSTKIAIFQDIGIQGTRKHSQSIEFGKKLALVSVKLRDTVHNHQK